MATTRSARGVVVDFDLLKIKEQMAATPKAAPVRDRENFIDQRFKRRVNRAKLVAEDSIADEAMSAESAAEPIIEEPIPTTSKPRINKDKA